MNTQEYAPYLKNRVWQSHSPTRDRRVWTVLWGLLWFYFERGDHLDVVRLLGERQDVAAILGAEITAN